MIAVQFGFTGGVHVDIVSMRHTSKRDHDTACFVSDITDWPRENIIQKRDGIIARAPASLRKLKCFFQKSMGTIEPIVGRLVAEAAHEPSVHPLLVIVVQIRIHFPNLQRRNTHARFPQTRLNGVNHNWESLSTTTCGGQDESSHQMSSTI